MIIAKIISFIIAATLLTEAVEKEDFIDVFLSFFAFLIAFGTKSI